MGLIEKALEKCNRDDSSRAQSALLEAMSARGLATPLYIFGANVDSAEWIHRLNVAAVIDDFADLPGRFEGADLIRITDVPDNALVINCVTNSKPSSAMRSLVERAQVSAYFGADLMAIFSGHLPPYEFVRRSRESVNERNIAWERLYESLADQQSRVTLEDILAYRLSGDPRILGNYSYRPREQYFESFLQLNQEVLVDGGAFDGETTELFIDRFDDYSAVHVFEPDPVNFQRCAVRLRDHRDLILHPLGLSDRPDQLRFMLGAGSASVIDEAGEAIISVGTVDDHAPNATFIKLDLEGWELKALEGAKATILRNKPKIAVGAYHSPDDFLKIFDWITALGLNYRVSLRHYTESWTETVLYFY